jgi:hypothetical protein
MPKKTEVGTIDLTKIANMRAVEKTEPGFEEKVTKAETVKKATGTGKYNFISEPELIPLPSGGKLYDKVTTDPEVLNGFIRLRQMTIKEEEILSTSRIAKTGSTTRLIISRCIDSDIDAKDILLFDSNYLLFRLRQISYGDEYQFELQCTNPVCEKKFQHKVIISKLKFETLPEDFVEPIKVSLPRSKYTVFVLLPRLYHSEEIYMRNTNRKKKSDDEDKRLVDNIWVTTVDIKDPDGNSIPQGEWEEFLSNLPSIDRAAITKATDYTTGVDRLEGVNCPYCEADYSGTIPIGIEFFRF